MRTKQLILRWSIVTGGLIALFWAIYYLVAGSVPTVTSIKMTETWTYVLPFGISRWWDILIGPIWSVVIILFTNPKVGDNDNEDLVISLTLGLAFGLLVGLAFGLHVSLTLSLAFGLTLSLAFGLLVSLALGLLVSLALGLSDSLSDSLALGLALGLLVSLAFSLTLSLAFGLLVGLALSLAFGLLVGLVTLIKPVASQSFLIKIGN